jgi:hypothetical protein
VRIVKRNAAFGIGALLGAAAAFVWDRRSHLRPLSATAPDARAAELREKLAEAKRAQADEDDFGAAGMGAETIVEETPSPRPPSRPEPPAGPPPADEFEAMRRRIHEEGKAAAEEMRRPSDEAS